MLIPREELRYAFQGAQFDTDNDGDRQFLTWIFNQFLYGEVTGIQCGHWLYHAPHLHGAAFIARQASEELSHVRKMLRILSLLGSKPSPAHPAIRFLSTSMMGGSWGEHVAIEMALGEGLVLNAFYAMEDTIAQPEIHKILQAAVLEEERHCAFGERETVTWLASHPADRKLLLGLALMQVFALRLLKRYVIGLIRRQSGENHAVLSQFDAFYDKTLQGFELRIERLGLTTKPLSRMGLGEKLVLVAAIPLRKLARRRERLLTSTYLKDPALGE